MLSNKDFAGLVNSGEDFGQRGSDGKTRFDLKQVQQWDKQIKKMDKRRQLQRTNVFGAADDEEEGPRGQSKPKKPFLPPGYRDRAEERRKGILSAEEAQLGEIASTLGVEQSKFLGGDVEHTHLVKGLDFALLNKIRKQQAKEAGAGSSGRGAESDSSSHEDSDENDDRDGRVGGSDAESSGDEEGSKDSGQLDIHTALGRQLHKLLFPKVDTAIAPRQEQKEAFIRIDTNPVASLQRSLPGAAKPSRDGLTSMYGKLGKAAQLLSRTVYEIPLGEARAESVPAAMTQAARDARNHEDLVNYSLPKPLAQRFKQLFVDGELRKAAKKRKESSALPPGVTAAQLKSTQTVARPSSFSSSAAEAVAVTPAYRRSSAEGSQHGSEATSHPVKSSGGGIYDDLLDDAAYVPSSSSIPSNGLPIPGRSGQDSLDSAGRDRDDGRVMGIFASFRPSTAAGAADQLRKPQPSLPTSDLISAVKHANPVKGISHNPPRAAASATGKPPPTAPSVVFRDVFASTSGEVVERKREEVEGSGKPVGDRFGLYGSYDDIYPDSKMYFDVAGDSEGEEADAPRKKMKIAGSQSAGHGGTRRAK